MSGRIAEGTIEEIRSRLDIVEVVSSYLPLKRSGNNHLGLCPFHGEKTPSFNVNASRQIYHCFGCGVGGNVFSFVMQMEGLTFPEAVRRLGERVGIEVAEEALSPQEQQRRQDRELYARINEAACDYYHRLLLEDPDGAPGRRYLKGRGYDGEIARRFRLGYAADRPDGLFRHLTGLGYQAAQIVSLGLVREGRDGRGHYDLFRRRLLFPILDERGRVVAFGGRVLDDSMPKYLNSTESPIYHKGSTLYGFFQARDEMRRSGEAIVVEGYFDLLALHRAGVTQSVATCGTALTPEQVRLLKRHTDRVLLLFDRDSAGRKATWRAMELLLPEGVPTAVVELDADKDPDAYLAAQGERGAEAVRHCLARARPVLEVFSEATLADHDAGIEGRARAVEEIVTKVRLLPSEIERSLYLKALAEKTGLDEGLLRRRGLPAAAPGRPVSVPVAETRERQMSTRRPPQPPESDGALKAQELLLQLMASEESSRQKVATDGVASLFPDLVRRRIAELILQQAAESETFVAEALFNHLDEEAKTILSGILIRDSGAVRDEPERIFEDCKRTAELTQLRSRCTEIKALQQLPEIVADPVRFAQLQQEYIELNKRIRLFR